MQDLPAIEALYKEIDATFERKRADAIAAGDAGQAEHAKAKQRLNDQAYFILCWGQIEGFIDGACRDAIRHGRQDRNWITRRAWYLYNPDDRRVSGLSFEDRAALVLDRDGAAWARLIEYYNLRNQIAHGRLRSDRLDVVRIVADFYSIQGAVGQ